MTSAEKRAALQQAGEPWPDCDCHGEPKTWEVDNRWPCGGTFRCRVVKRRQTKARVDGLKADGRCIRCGGPVDTEVYCRTHADEHNVYMARPDQYIKRLSAEARYRARRRQQEGFQSTGAGLAAFAAWTEGRT